MDRELWRLRVEVAWTHGLLALVSVRGITTPRAEVHVFLSEHYFRLAELHARRGATARADQLRRKAEWHLERGDSDEPPRAPVALALSRPRPPRLVWVVGGRSKPPDHP
jgi:hypothetical protein